MYTGTSRIILLDLQDALEKFISKNQKISIFRPKTNNELFFRIPHLYFFHVTLNIRSYKHKTIPLVLHFRVVKSVQQVLLLYILDCNLNYFDCIFETNCISQHLKTISLHKQFYHKNTLDIRCNKNELMRFYIPYSLEL